MVYQILLLIGAIGLVVQTLLGFSHAGAGHRGPAGNSHSAALLHAHGNAHAHAHGHVHVHLDVSSLLRQAATALWTLFSPLTIFSVCLGAGAAGILAQAFHERPAVTIALAFSGGMAFYGLIVRPLSGLLLRFASKPAKTLSGVVAQEAEVVSRFDARGRGVVRVTVDGQSARLLAHLETDDQDKVATIAPGDRLVVTGVDRKTNTCRVTVL